MPNPQGRITIRNIMIATFWVALGSAILAALLDHRPPPNQLSILPGLFGACLTTAGWSLFGRHKTGIAIGMGGGLLGTPLTLFSNKYLMAGQINPWVVFGGTLIVAVSFAIGATVIASVFLKRRHV